MADVWNLEGRTHETVKIPPLIFTGRLSLAIPVCFFEGIYDYACSYTLAASYHQSLKAPVKGFCTFAQSAHSPMFEEPERMQQVLREVVLAGANRLAGAD